MCQPFSSEPARSAPPTRADISEGFRVSRSVANQLVRHEGSLRSGAFCPSVSRSVANQLVRPPLTVVVFASPMVSAVQ